jgi:hypothetical protein
MGFSKEYLELCMKHASSSRKKRTAYGDWFIRLSKDQLGICTNPNEVDFSDPDFVYIPDLDDLIELWSNQLNAIGGDKETQYAMKIENCQNGWMLDVSISGMIVHVEGCSTMHEALFAGLIQSSVVLRRKIMK